MATDGDVRGATWRPARATAWGRLLLGVLAASVVLGSACGSDGSVTVSQQAQGAVPDAATQARAAASDAVAQAQDTLTTPTTTSMPPTTGRTTRTIPVAPARTVTQPAQTSTVTETVTAPTRTATVPSRSSTVARTTEGTVTVVPATTGSDGGDSDTWWVWLLVGLGVAGVVLGIVLVRRGRRDDASSHPAAADAAAPQAPAEAPEEDPPA